MSQADQDAKDRLSTRKRVITSLIGIPIVVALVWFNTPIPWFTLLAVGWGLGGVHEFYNLVKRSKEISPLVYFGLLWSLLLIISPHIGSIPHFNGISSCSLFLTAGVIISLLLLLWRNGKEQAFSAWAWTVAGVLYIGWLLSNLVALRMLEDGRGWVFLAILSTFASDSSAYFAGRALGKHKLAPYISPKKSWEGTAAGIAGAIACSTILAYLFGLPVSWWKIVILGALLSMTGQLGDLVKSLFKRNMAVKDSGNILPGHGGFLDRMDSLAFAGVIVYYFVLFTT
ncbi:MAG: phosphatidate cytidylyltransferase [Dehalococcoidales bacterium]|nr:phosphatidate cytidylyltransferase [Dehalococcoidales bacterium]